MKTLIKHEVHHIMYNHLKRSENIRGSYCSTAINKAMDISINQYIKYMPAWADTLKSVSLTYNIDLERDLPFEEYARIIQEGMDKLKASNGPEILENKEDSDNNSFMRTSHDSSYTHDIWLESEDSFNFEQIEELTKKTANNAGKGKVPSQFQKIMEEFNTKPEISWKDYLKKIVGTLPLGYKRTITRKDRRQPYRLDLRGKLPNRVAQIIITIDISGSITDEEINQIMIEIFSIVKNQPTEIIIIECDNQIRRAYKVETKNDIKAKLDTKGGTAFSPVFEYIYTHKMRNHLLIYFTDGAGEKKLSCTPINYKTLWVLTGKEEELSLEKSYGLVKKLSNIKAETSDPTYAKDTMKEILMEWAK